MTWREETWLLWLGGRIFYVRIQVEVKKFVLRRSSVAKFENVTDKNFQTAFFPSWLFNKLVFFVTNYMWNKKSWIWEVRFRRYILFCTSSLILFVTFYHQLFVVAEWVEQKSRLGLPITPHETASSKLVNISCWAFRLIQPTDLNVICEPSKTLISSGRSQITTSFWTVQLVLSKRSVWTYLVIWKLILKVDAGKLRGRSLQQHIVMNYLSTIICSSKKRIGKIPSFGFRIKLFTVDIPLVVQTGTGGTFILRFTKPDKLQFRLW